MQSAINLMVFWYSGTLGIQRQQSHSLATRFKGIPICHGFPLMLDMPVTFQSIIKSKLDACLSLPSTVCILPCLHLITNSGRCHQFVSLRWTDACIHLMSPGGFGPGKIKKKKKRRCPLVYASISRLLLLAREKKKKKKTLARGIASVLCAGPYTRAR